MRDKDELLSRTSEAFGELRSAIAGLDEDRMRRVWLGTWGVRDILAHISGWHREMIPALGRVARGEAPYPQGAYDDFDAWNARFATAKRAAKTSEILDDLEASHRDFVAAAAALADEHLEPDATARKIIDGTGPEHYREHAAQIAEWRRGA
ncbi:MAG: ClbS/DfsB family four-helix bundle protein [Candidatus Rokuibacteriota bacterium]